ncbi:MAG: hypothetical protein ACJ751_05595 [Niastella sp.]|uniref:hypothetical protein n=1 Tax=Niastella sp. TaxID=1869183 RepID=UPI00389B06DB
MKKELFAFVVMIVVVSVQGKAQNATSLTQFVDPNIGTAHCRWFHYTPGAVPFGMAKPAPSNFMELNRCMVMGSDRMKTRDNWAPGM